MGIGYILPPLHLSYCDVLYFLNTRLPYQMRNYFMTLVGSTRVYLIPSKRPWDTFSLAYLRIQLIFIERHACSRHHALPGQPQRRGPRGKNMLLNWREYSLESSTALWPYRSDGTYLPLHGAIMLSSVMFPMWLLVLPRQRTTAYLFFIPLIRHRGQQTLARGPNVACYLFFIWPVSYKQCW